MRSVLDRPAVRASFEALLRDFACANPGSSTCFAAAILLDEPPSLDAQEITDKGSINQRAVLRRRSTLVAQLYGAPGPGMLIAARPSPEMRSVAGGDFDPDQLTAIDVHVHLEIPGQATAADVAAEKYFGGGSAGRDSTALAEYYRSRKIGFVVFTVDEDLTGKARVTNDDVLRFAADNADIALPFVSLNPTRGAAAVEEARRLVATGRVRGLKLHPPVQQFWPNDRLAYPLYEVFAAAKLPVLFHTGHSGIGTGMPGGGGIRLKYGNPLPIDDVAVGLSRDADHPRPPVVPVAGRSDFDLPA